MLALRILSGTGPLWYFLGFWLLAANNSNQGPLHNTIAWLVFLFAFNYAITHAIISIWQGFEHKNYGLVVLSIIGFVVYEFCALRLGSCYGDIGATVGCYALGIGYASLFAIVAFILSFKKSKKVV